MEILPYNRLALHLIYGFANKIPNFIPHSPITHSIQSTHRIRSGPQRDVGMGGFFIARGGSVTRLREIHSADFPILRGFPKHRSVISVHILSDFQSDFPLNK